MLIKIEDIYTFPYLEQLPLLQVKEKKLIQILLLLMALLYQLLIINKSL